MQLESLLNNRKTLQRMSAAQQKVQRHIENRNKQIGNQESALYSAFLEIQSLLGVDNIESSSIFSLNEEQILYYACRNYVIYNIASKEYQIINKDIKGAELLQLKSFDTCEGNRKLIVGLYQTQKHQSDPNGISAHQTEASSEVQSVNEGKTTKTNTKTLIEQSQTGGSQTQVSSLRKSEGLRKKEQSENEAQSAAATNTYLGVLVVKTDYESRNSRQRANRFEWKVIKLHNRAITIEDINYHPKKGYLYFVATKNVDFHPHKTLESTFRSKQKQKVAQSVWVFDLKKELMLINQEIRSSTVGYFVRRIVVEEDSSKVYLLGKNYFRLWTINFNERKIKESNARNVERMLKGKEVVDVRQIHRYHTSSTSVLSTLLKTPEFNQHLSHNKELLFNPSKLLLVLTQKELLLVKDGELICFMVPERNVSKQPKNKDNIEKELENSLNQIYKMKFLFEEEEEHADNKRQKEHGFGIDLEGQNCHDKKSIDFTCISDCWMGQDKNHYFAIATNKSNVLIYQLCDYQVRLETEYNYSGSQGCPNRSTSYDFGDPQFKSILPIQKGDILLLTCQDKQVRLINQEVSENEEETILNSLWGNGQMHQGVIIDLASPNVQNIVCTAGADGTFKLWSFKKNDRSIVFQDRSQREQVRGLTIHPGGMILAVNFETEIKLFSILPKEFYEITSVKTNYSSLQLGYSPRGEFLVSNEGHVLIFYEPFSLKMIGCIEPSDLKHKIKSFSISKGSDYICFLTEDNSVYVKEIEINALSKWEYLVPAHIQTEQYTCFHLDTSLSLGQNSETPHKGASTSNNSIFIGATKNKYMVLYGNYGKDIIAEFPVIDECQIVDMQVSENLLFVATSKATIRVYRWPILEENLFMEVIGGSEKKIRYKQPEFEEFQIWHQSIPIQKLHKLSFSNEFVVANNRGNLTTFKYHLTKNRKPVYEEISAERKKMEQLINEVFYIKKSETEKRNKLIEKTETDILKVENEIMREKIVLDKKLQDEQNSLEKTFNIKSQIQEDEKREYMEKEKREIEILKTEIEKKIQILNNLKCSVTQSYTEKKLYERKRNTDVQQEIKVVIQKHKQKIAQKIVTHKEDINNKKREYYLKVKDTQRSFEEELQQKLEEILASEGQSECNQTSQAVSGAQKNGNRVSSRMQRVSVSNILNGIDHRVKSMEQELNDEIVSELTSKESEEIIIQGCRVEDLQRSNSELEREISRLKEKVNRMQLQDESLQKEFQRNLQDYNLSRFQNLNFHSEVLKMQNQLIERRQVLENKEEIVMLAFQEKQKLENYKELVKGSLSKLQDRKESMREGFFKKENDLNLIFSELVNEIQKMEEKKVEIQRMERKVMICEQELGLREESVKEVVGRLKEIKRFLLLERMNDDREQKWAYQEEEGLVAAINFLRKRLFMDSVKEKKSKQLKKSALSQVLKQNKNLLEECNQLRSEGIDYENEIKNLSDKLKEANRMIAVESKLKNQRSDVSHQKGQLDIIRQLFKLHLHQFEADAPADSPQASQPKEPQQGQQGQQQKHFNSEQDMPFSANAENSVCHFDAEEEAKPQRLSELLSSEVGSAANIQLNQKSHFQKQISPESIHKPFHLSGQPKFFIEAEEL